MNGVASPLIHVCHMCSTHGARQTETIHITYHCRVMAEGHHLVVSEPNAVIQYSKVKNVVNERLRLWMIVRSTEDLEKIVKVPNVHLLL